VQGRGSDLLGAPKSGEGLSPVHGLKSIQQAAPGIGAERPIPFTVCTGRCSTGAVRRQQVEQRQIDGRRPSKPIVPSEGCSSGHVAGRLSSKQEDQWNGLPDLDSPAQR